MSIIKRLLLLKRVARTSRGFTIVELLIVIVVVGILAAIVVVAYRGIQESSRATAIQADLTNASKNFKYSRLSPEMRAIQT